MVTGSTYYWNSYIERKEKFSIDNGILPVGIGIEYSCLSVKEDEIYDKYVQLERYIKNRSYLDKLFQVHMDFDIIEITTMPTTSYVNVIRTYRHLIKLFKKFELVGRCEGIGSGGLHFHFDLPKMKIHSLCVLLRDLFIDIANRPYLNWIFNEPIDNINANSFFHNKDSRRFISKLNAFKYFDFNILNDVNFKKKSKAVRYDNHTHTVELRIFDMVVSEEEFVAVLNFACNYYESFIIKNKSQYGGHIKNVLKVNKNNYNTTDKIRSYLDDFKDLLTRLDLNFENYKTFIERNYNVRTQWGKKYLL